MNGSSARLAVAFAAAWVLGHGALAPGQLGPSPAPAPSATPLDGGLLVTLDIVAGPAGTLGVEDFPLRPGLSVDLSLEPFSVIRPGTRFVLGRRGGADRPAGFDPSQVRLYRGTVPGLAGSDVFLALSPWGSGGWVDLGPGRERFGITSRAPSGVLDAGRLWVAPATGTPPPGLPVAACGLTAAHSAPAAAPAPSHPLALSPSPDPPPESGEIKGLRVIQLAVETDYEFFELFGDTNAAGAYVTQLYGAVSAIYIRDNRVRVDLSFVRLWDTPQDLFNEPEPLDPFRTYWNANMGHVTRDAAQFCTGRRDLSAGGVAWVSALCTNYGYSWAGYTLGFYESPDGISAFNRDIMVTAHELGHNAGTLHTQDYGLDTCHDPHTPPRRGGIMSYCGQTFSGGNYNHDLRFETVTTQKIREHVEGRACVIDDCNGNGTHDAEDIRRGASRDANGNGLPDECEDCNANLVLDTLDISRGTSLDRNNNTIPDECETDCNRNGRPDDYDISQGTSTDAYYNGVPDECEEDCNNNRVSDYTEIILDMTLDRNRNARLDACEDCDGDRVSDLAELDGAWALWIATGHTDQRLHSFLGNTGVSWKRSANNAAPGAMDVLITLNGRVLVSLFNRDAVAEYTRAGVFLRNFVAPGGGGLDGPCGLALGPGGDLFVASRNNARVLRFDITTGAPEGVFAQGGGLTQPFGVHFQDGGNLFVTSNNGSVLEYHGTTGAFVRVFVAAGAGGLSEPRGLCFLPGGDLLVCSFNTDAVLRYRAGTGEPLGKWNRNGTPTRLTLENPWGIRRGPDGDIYVSRNGVGPESPPGPEPLHLTQARVYQFDVRNGNMVRAYVEGHDTELYLPTGFDFMPDQGTDANRNFIPDECECYPDCDRSTGVGTLDIFDFLCFQNRYSAGDPYACDCDQSTGGGVCDIFDFLCFQNAYDAGCP